MEFIEIEQTTGYTEHSKYYVIDVEGLELIFKQRLMDWSWYYRDAMDRAIASKASSWRLSYTDILTDTLREYDRSIRGEYNRKAKKGICIEDIYKSFAKRNIDCKLFKFIKQK